MVDKSVLDSLDYPMCKQLKPYSEAAKLLSTYINTPLGKVRIYDNWVHVKNCKPFKLYYEYKK